LPDGRRGATLLATARAAVASVLGVETETVVVPDDGLRAVGSSFVTLTLGGRLRGCIGSLSFDRPLIEDVSENAVAAAFRDRRFPPLRRDELDAVRFEVSVLSLPEPLPSAASVAEAAGLLRPGLDGAVLECGAARGVFLPQVWEGLPEPIAFLGQLRRKAGLAETGWDDATRLWRFEVEKWSEAPPAD
jgi:AmmeMemoRadiSam system protein A